jgi:hypothetical protein
MLILIICNIYFKNSILLRVESIHIKKNNFRYIYKYLRLRLMFLLRKFYVTKQFSIFKYRIEF